MVSKNGLMTMMVLAMVICLAEAGVSDLRNKYRNFATRGGYAGGAASAAASAGPNGVSSSAAAAYSRQPAAGYMAPPPPPQSAAQPMQQQPHHQRHHQRAHHQPPPPQYFQQQPAGPQYVRQPMYRAQPQQQYMRPAAMAPAPPMYYEDDGGLLPEEPAYNQYGGGAAAAASAGVAQPMYGQEMMDQYDGYGAPTAPMPQYAPMQHQQQQHKPRFQNRFSHMQPQGHYPEAAAPAPQFVKSQRRPFYQPPAAATSSAAAAAGGRHGGSAAAAAATASGAGTSSSVAGAHGGHSAHNGAGAAAAASAGVAQNQQYYAPDRNQHVMDREESHQQYYEPETVNQFEARAGTYGDNAGGTFEEGSYVRDTESVENHEDGREDGDHYYNTHAYGKSGDVNKYVAYNNDDEDIEHRPDLFRKRKSNTNFVSNFNKQHRETGSGVIAHDKHSAMYNKDSKKLKENVDQRFSKQSDGSVTTKNFNSKSDVDDEDEMEMDSRGLGTFVGVDGVKHAKRPQVNNPAAAAAAAASASFQAGR